MPSCPPAAAPISCFFPCAAPAGVSTDCAACLVVSTRVGPVARRLPDTLRVAPPGRNVSVACPSRSRPTVAVRIA